MPTPIETYNSSVLYTADGLTSVFPFPFAYQNAADIYVSKNDVDQAGLFTITGGNAVSLSPMPAAGARVKIYRKTGHTGRRVDFTDGATITEADLDKAGIQHFYMGQEGYDLAKSLVNTVGDVATAVQTCTDAKNSSYASQVAALASRNDALAFAFQADASNSAAISAKNAAESARDAALSYSNSASANAFSALGYKDTAVASAATATTQAGIATTARIASEAARDISVAVRDQIFTAPTNGASSIVYPANWADWSVAPTTLNKAYRMVFMNAFIEAPINPHVAGEKIATLPVGYRPLVHAVRVAATYYRAADGGYHPCAVNILTNGEIYVFSVDGLYNPEALNNIIFINYTFLAA